MSLAPLSTVQILLKSPHLLDYSPNWLWLGQGRLCLSNFPETMVLTSIIFLLYWPYLLFSFYALIFLNFCFKLASHTLMDYLCWDGVRYDGIKCCPNVSSLLSQPVGRTHFNFGIAFLDQPLDSWGGGRQNGGTENVSSSYNTPGAKLGTQFLKWPTSTVFCHAVHWCSPRLCEIWDS